QGTAASPRYPGLASETPSAYCHRATSNLSVSTWRRDELTGDARDTATAMIAIKYGLPATSRYRLIRHRTAWQTPEPARPLPSAFLPVNSSSSEAPPGAHCPIPDSGLPQKWVSAKHPHRPLYRSLSTGILHVSTCTGTRAALAGGVDPARDDRGGGPLSAVRPGPVPGAGRGLHALYARPSYVQDQPRRPDRPEHGIPPALDELHAGIRRRDRGHGRGRRGPGRRHDPAHPGRSGPASRRRAVA